MGATFGSSKKSTKQRSKAGFYPKLAWTNLRKNSRVYLPYLLTCVITVLMFYVMSAIAKNKGIDEMPGAYSMHIIMKFAVAVTEIFAAIFLFYTNSILIKQRKKELGLLSVLGLDKGNLAHMLAWESIFTAGISIFAGLLGGIALGKLLFLILLKIVRFPVPLAFAVEWRAILESVVIFGIIFFLCFLWNVYQTWKTNPIELLHGSQEGEKEPRSKMILALIGAAALGSGYYIAQTTENPVQAVSNVFVAVILVIIGTYALFTAGSIALLKSLKKWKNYYYQPKHFTVVSGMLYRMKQNAVGLANICIMSCAVLALVSVTLSLYLGVEDIVNSRYSREYVIYVDRAEDEQVEKAQQIIKEELERAKVEAGERLAYRMASLSVLRDGNRLLTETEDADIVLDDVCGIYLIPLVDYNRLEGKNVTLEDGEVLLYTAGDTFSEGELWLGENQFEIKEQLENFEIAGKSTDSMIQTVYLVMENAQVIRDLCIQYGGALAADAFSYHDSFDIEGEEEACVSARQEIDRRLNEEVENARSYWREDFRENEYISCGGFLFMGIFVGLLFLTGAILIIYYKQISEGYDDRERFQIMKKVGMSQQEIKGTIRSQVLLVFFLPLCTAIVHIAFAFRIFSKAMVPFGLMNTTLELYCMIGTAAVFTVFYIIVFLFTSREYYRIVR